ncbi:MAG: ATP-binding protein [Gammaproteobacteria bacterium]|nr:ATP-binding protein [Gammaproteobacteria bacterium]MYF52660.1 ATP-binding protein [Gammaproteobacteria bacterium]MYK44167.1 ATP-binding protein [Gammaproteobacteria bacterium]
MPDRNQNVDWKYIVATHWQWENSQSLFQSIPKFSVIELDDLLEIERQKTSLFRNTKLFCKGFSANNALLWGARGTGKSSLIHALLNHFASQGLRLIEIEKRHFQFIHSLIEDLYELPYKFLIVCDDLSFNENDSSFMEMKSTLEGSIFNSADKFLFYVTSNRRHLVAEPLADNEIAYQQEIHTQDVFDEKLSLADRFGLWLSFHPFTQQQYLNIVHFWTNKLAIEHQVAITCEKTLEEDAIRWVIERRGDQSGRSAHHFARSWIGDKLYKMLD